MSECWPIRGSSAYGVCLCPVVGVAGGGAASGGASCVGEPRPRGLPEEASRSFMIRRFRMVTMCVRYMSVYMRACVRAPPLDFVMY